MVLRAVASGAAGILSAGGQFNVSGFGATGNGQTLSDITTTSGNASISSASYTFTQADVGKLITIAGAGVAAARLNTSIASVSAGSALLTVSPSTSIVGIGVATFGTDDTAAIQAAVNAAAVAPLVNGGVVVLNNAIYIVNSITWLSKVSMRGLGAGKSVLFNLTIANMSHAVIEGLAGSSTTQYTDCQFRDFEIDCSASVTTSYNVVQKAFYIQYMLRAVFKSLYVHDAPATGIGVDFLQKSYIEGCIVQNCGRGNNGSGLGGAGIGIAVAVPPQASYEEDTTVIGNYIIDNKRYGIFFESAGTSCAINAWARIIGNYVHMSATSIHGIGDCGVTNLVCTDNTVVGVSGCGDGIIVNAGTLNNVAGIQGVIANNVITSYPAANGCSNGITIDYSVRAPNVGVGSAACEYLITGNRVYRTINTGIKIVAASATSLDTLLIKNNIVALSGASAVLLSGAGGLNDVTISENTFKNNALTTGAAKLKCGVSIQAAVSKFRMENNVIFDNQGSPTQAFALIIDSAAVTGAIVQGNDFSGNLTGAISLTTGGTIAGTLINNVGYNSVGRVTAQVAAAASVATLTVPSSDSSYRVSANVLVTTATAHNFTVTCAYTDEGNTARTLTFNFSTVAGVLATPIINTGGTVPYEGVPMHIRCKAATTITIATTGTFTTVTYNAEGFIEQLMT